MHRVPPLTDLLRLRLQASESAPVGGAPATSERYMRFIAAAFVLVAVLCSNVSVQAENRIFIIANDPDGYGVDRCLATGASCGAAVATAYCRSREFAQAASFRRVEREEITGAIPIGVTKSEEFVAIECSR
jgi:hypothetical protein